MKTEWDNNLTRALLIAGTTLLLTGCLEVVQHIGTGSGNTVDNYIRITLQRSIFSFAESFGGEAPSDDEFAREFGMTENEVMKDLPEGVTAQFEPIVTDYDYGFALTTTTNRSFRAERDAAFIPQLVGDELHVMLPPGNDEEANEAAFFLASAKYRIIVDKTILPILQEANLINTRGESVPVDLTEFQNVWLVEFPVLLWLSAGDQPLVVLR